MRFRRCDAHSPCTVLRPRRRARRRRESGPAPSVKRSLHAEDAAARLHEFAGLYFDDRIPALAQLSGRARSAALQYDGSTFESRRVARKTAARFFFLNVNYVVEHPANQA